MCALFHKELGGGLWFDSKCSFKRQSDTCEMFRSHVEDFDHHLYLLWFYLVSSSDERVHIVALCIDV